jgi:hypothetical protein
MKRTIIVILIVFLVAIAGRCFAKNSADVKTTKCSTLKEVCQVRAGDTFYKLFGSDWKVVADVNRISPLALRPGMELIVPHDLGIAKELYCPFPQRIEDNIQILIDLDSQALGVYANRELQKWYPISSGKEGHKTPTGSFRIIRKDKNYKSKTYPKPEGGAPMPYALNFYRGFWIHAGKLPGYPASHGCVRLIKRDARELFQITKIGYSVVIGSN